MKIQSITIQNFRNVPNIEKQINGQNILLLGENKVGKTNFQKALRICMGDTSLVGVDPIKAGEKFSFIEVVLGDDGQKYEFKCELELGKDKPKITVKQPNGLRSSTKSTIGSITGELSFDIDKFIEDSSTVKGRKDQIETFKSFLPEEVQEALRKHETTCKNLYDDRTNVNRDITRLEGAIKESRITEADKDQYFLKEDTEKLKEQLAKAADQNTTRQKGVIALNKVKSELSMDESLVKQNEVKIESLKAEIAKLEEASQALVNQITEKQLKEKEIQAWLDKNPEVDVTELNNKMSKAFEHNAMHDKVTALRKQEGELEQLKKESENLTVQYEASKEAIRSAVRNDIDSPFQELSYDDESLLYNGKKVDSSTMSTAEIMELGLKMQMARNAGAKVLFIGRGESLGAKKLKAIQEIAEKNDYQIIMEQVERGVEELKIEIMGKIE